MSATKSTILTAVFGLVLVADPLGINGQAKATEIINVRSGYDEVNSVSLANGAADANIAQISAPAGTALSGSAFTLTDFQNAQAGGTAFVTAPHPNWLPPASFTDPLARWINWTGSIQPKTVLYAVPFTVTTPNITNATLSFDWCVDDGLGDPSGPNAAGVYMGIGTGAGVATTPVISAGAYTPASSAFCNITGQVQTGTNYLYVYQRDLGAVASGTIFSATITVVPEPATIGVVGFATIALLMRRPRRNAATSA